VSEYPRCRYHATLPPRIVDNPIEDLALGDGWFDSPERTKTPVFDPSTAFSAPLPEVSVSSVWVDTAPEPTVEVTTTPAIAKMKFPANATYQEPKPKRSYGPYKRRATGV
jgi:hypothetical protein